MSRPDGDAIPIRTEIVSLDEAFSVHVGNAHLRLQWAGDRWAHALEWGGRELANTLEWSSDDDHPERVVSPAYQQLHHQESPEGIDALLVGQWGHHHFSGVFRIAPPSTAGIRVSVDIAARSRGPLETLAATYRIALGSSDLVEASPESVRWRLDSSGGVLQCQPGAGNVLALAEAGRRETVLQIVASSGDKSPTRRLAYSWLWAF